MSDIEDLEKLAELKEKGLVTEEEFERNKQALLSRSLPQQEAVADSPKSRIVYALLGVFLGFLGAHNFYLGRKVQGFFQMSWIFFFVLKFFFPTDEGIWGTVFFVGCIYLIAYIVVIPFWVGLNLILTSRDGRGRLMKKDGRVVSAILGALTLSLCLLTIPAACTAGIFGLAALSQESSMNRTSIASAILSKLADTDEEVSASDKTTVPLPVAGLAALGQMTASGELEFVSLITYATACAVASQLKALAGEEVVSKDCSVIVGRSAPLVKSAVVTKADKTSGLTEITVSGVGERAADILLEKTKESEDDIQFTYNKSSKKAIFTFKRLLR